MVVRAGERAAQRDLHQSKPMPNLTTATINRLAQALILTTIAGVVMGLLGPFGSYLNDGLLARIVYWVGTSWVGLILFGGALVIINSRTAQGSVARTWSLIVMVPIVSIIQTVLTRASAIAIWPVVEHVGPGWLIWYGQVLLVASIIVAAWTLIPSAPAASDAAPTPLPAVLPRPQAATAPDFSGDVIALQMEDHYVRIHRGSSSELILMPMTQAIAAMGDVDGIRTHRSWWIARHAVVRAVGPPRAMRIDLNNGVSAPVSRAAVAQLRAAGWLDGTP